MEFLKLEDDLRQEDEKQQKQFMKEQQMQNYYQKQKAKIAEYGVIKMQRQQERLNKEKLEKDLEIKERKERINKNEEMKAKIRMYKEYKAQQILELQMREQNIIASSKRRNVPGGPNFYMGSEQQVNFNGGMDQNSQFGSSQNLKNRKRQHKVQMHEGQIDEMGIAEETTQEI